MAAEEFAAPHQQAIAPHLRLPVAEAERAAAGRERQQARHGMGLGLAVLQAAA